MILLDKAEQQINQGAYGNALDTLYFLATNDQEKGSRHRVVRALSLLAGHVDDPRIEEALEYLAARSCPFAKSALKTTLPAERGKLYFRMGDYERSLEAHKASYEAGETAALSRIAVHARYIPDETEAAIAYLMKNTYRPSFDFEQAVTGRDLPFYKALYFSDRGDEEQATNFLSVASLNGHKKAEEQLQDLLPIITLHRRPER